MLAVFLSLSLPAISLASRDEEPETTMQQMQLLQHQLALERAEERRLKEAQPLHWIHFPKTGSSFVNTITHLPGTCPSLANHALNEDTVGGGACWLSRWLEQCQGVCNVDKYSCPQPCHVHYPVSNYSAQRGHLVGMFRDPDQRILSGYHDDANNFAAYTEDNFNQDFGGKCKGEVLEKVPKKPLLEFAETWKGGMTYQLVMEHPITLTVNPSRPKVTLRDALEAARRVREGFAFVGLTEQWDLSICLFHKMFGGPCHAFEFENTRPSYAGKSADQDYDTAQLQGWHDDIDEVVYAAASEVFRRNLILFNVSKETCEEFCSH
ncbi:unnamed protein product [Symbiodinium natans]|uniref:Uncharacterized protein n=1 Tax=Symbiodinium natans TaxID=878477 RepID=A0A812J6A5_9DINO|nr:unnamed protein product [Symbiodinium natans]